MLRRMCKYKVGIGWIDLEFLQQTVAFMCMEIVLNQHRLSVQLASVLNINALLNINHIR